VGPTSFGDPPQLRSRRRGSANRATPAGCQPGTVPTRRRRPGANQARCQLGGKLLADRLHREHLGSPVRPIPSSAEIQSPATKPAGSRPCPAQRRPWPTPSLRAEARHDRQPPVQSVRIHSRVPPTETKRQPRPRRGGSGAHTRGSTTQSCQRYPPAVHRKLSPAVDNASRRSAQMWTTPGEIGVDRYSESHFCPQAVEGCGFPVEGSGDDGSGASRRCPQGRGQTPWITGG
jgi:hypothetical protein